MDLEPTKMPTGELECLQTDLNPVGPEDLRIWSSSANRPYTGAGLLVLRHECIV